MIIFLYFPKLIELVTLIIDFINWNNLKLNWFLFCWYQSYNFDIKLYKLLISIIRLAWSKEKNLNKNFHSLKYKTKKRKIACIYKKKIQILFAIRMIYIRVQLAFMFGKMIRKIKELYKNWEIYKKIIIQISLPYQNSDWSVYYFTGFWYQSPLFDFWRLQMQLWIIPLKLYQIVNDLLCYIQK